MTYVLQLAADEDFAYSAQLLKSLHFMMRATPSTTGRAAGAQVPSTFKRKKRAKSSTRVQTLTRYRAHRRDHGQPQRPS